MDVFVIEQVIDLSGVNMPMIYRQALTQHDAYAHEWRVSIKRHGHAVDLTGCTAQVYFGPENKTGDGIVPGEALTQRAVAQGGAAYAQLLPELYQIDGRIMAIMQISDPEDHVMTAAVLRLHTSGVLEGDIGDPSGSVIELGALLAQLDELRTQTAAAREAVASAQALSDTVTAAETDRETAEAARVSAENTREGHESTRELHEQSRMTAENVRNGYETQRKTAETARAEADTARAKAETARADAETARSASEAARVTAEDARATAENIRVTEENARAEAEMQRTETFAGYEERIVAATPDDTTVDGRAWTSKKTVDSLCMPLEATGNPLQVYPVEGYPLGVKVSWEPVQEGEGDPSPENIRPIKGRDSVTVTRCGENLLNPEENGDTTFRPYGLTVTYIGDNKIHISGTYETEGGSFVILDTKQKNLAGRNLKITGFAIEGTERGYTLYGLRTKDETVIAMSVSFVEGDVIDMTIAIVVSQDTPSAYIPYTGSTTDIALPETVYGGTLDLETGVVTVDNVLITADRSWFTLIGADKKYYQTNKAGQDYPYPKTNQEILTPNTQCNVARIAEPYGTGSESDYLVYVLHDGRIRMSVGLYDSDADIKICYPIKDPYTIQLTPQQIAALSGVNTLYSDAGTLTVTGREDPRHTIVTLTDRIAALESAAAGV